MALRSLGSSLVAKATPGSTSRDLLEKQITKPAIPGKGEIGTVSRDLVNEPQVVAAAPGSEKVISAGPGVEGSQIMSPTEGQPIKPSESLLGGAMGMSGAPLRSGSMPMSMMDTNASRVSASAPAAGGKSATSRSGVGQSGDVRAVGNILPTGASTSVQAPNIPSISPSNPSLAGTLSSRVSAAPEGFIGPMPNAPEVNRGLFNTSSAIDPSTGRVVSATKTLGQVVAGAVGKGLSSLGATNAGNKLQSFGGSSTASAQGKGSVSNVLRSIVSGASSAVNKLRSLFKK